MQACQLNNIRWLQMNNSPSQGTRLHAGKGRLRYYSTEVSGALQIKCKTPCLLGSKPDQERNLALYWKHTALLVHIPQTPAISSRNYQVKDCPQ